MVADFKKKQKHNLKNRSLLFFGGIVVIVICVFLVVADVKIYHERQVLNLQIENLKSKIQDIQNKNNDLKQGIEKANNDQYIEKIAREELDMQKPGEKVFSFIEAPAQVQKNTTESKNTFQIWLDSLNSGWNWIKSKF